MENDAIKEYLLADNAIVSKYGWINPKYADERFIKEIEQDFARGNVFPLINQLPFYNIFEMDSSFLAAILNLNKIQQAEEKTLIIENSLTQDLDINEICRILSVPESHPVFDFIGTKTIFWEASFETFDCNVYAIFAAIPDTRNHKKIDKYILIEKSVNFKEGK